MAEAWKVRFRERVVQVDGRCRHVVDSLAAALAHLAAPVLTANAEEGRARMKLAEAAAREASDDLDFIMVATGEVTALALRGGARDPSEPLASVLGLRVGNLRYRYAVGKLLVSMEGAEAAYGVLKLFDIHLMVMGLLLDRPGLCGYVDTLIEDELHGAIAILRDHAVGLAEECALLAEGALEDVDRRN